MPLEAPCVLHDQHKASSTVLGGFTPPKATSPVILRPQRTGPDNLIDMDGQSIAAPTVYTHCVFRKLEPHIWIWSSAMSTSGMVTDEQSIEKMEVVDWAPGSIHEGGPTGVRTGGRLLIRDTTNPPDLRTTTRGRLEGDKC